MKMINSLFGLRSFLILWGFQTVSELGTAMTNYALIIWVYGQRGDATSLTVMTLCAFCRRFSSALLLEPWRIAGTRSASCWHPICWPLAERSRSSRFIASRRFARGICTRSMSCSA